MSLSVDETGIRLGNRDGTRHFPWQALAAVGFTWAPTGTGRRSHTLELRTSGEAGGETLRIPADANRPRARLHEAFQLHAPHLYFGLQERSPSVPH
ncbi:PH domain-containing protein [Streptomyces sp. Da 82-17]|uniref:PH domain-containing protein n=1 Tax=Streptomyces sp. Da 82-17 TaxID=3377116 RepID=UPI0038D4D473